MDERIEKRLTELRSEHAHGRKVFVELEQQRINLEQTLLRISGAIQVLEELSAEPAMPEATEGQHGDNR